MLKEFLQTKRGGVIQTPEGFIMYSRPNDNSIRVDGLYVLPEWGEGCASNHLINQVCSIGRDNNCDYIESYIERELKHRAAYLLFYGFTISDEDDRWVYFRKDL